MSWRMVESDGTCVVYHIAEVQLESVSSFSQWLSSPEVRALAAGVTEAHLNRLGIAHRIDSGDDSPLTRVEYLHASRPLVSIILVSKDQCAALQRCIDTLLERTAYAEYELLLVDNGSESAEARVWFDGMAQLGGERLRVLSYPQQGNAAAVRNFAAQQARGEYLLLLNPYAVITNGQWLDEMLAQAQRPEVGVVGAKLFSPEGRVLHAGVILGLRGPAGLPFYGEVMQSAGYMYRLQAVHDLSAVGADCLLVRKSLFDSLGGLDEESFAHTLNEVDFCLRVGQSNHLVVWTPFAQLALGAVPGVVLGVEEQVLRQNEEKSFYQRWLPIVARDPAYNPSLTLDSLNGSSFSLEPGLREGWSPFSARHLPKIMALPINASAVGHYRITQPLIELEASGRATGRTYYTLPSIIEVERQSPDVIVQQGRYTALPIEEIAVLMSYSNARRIYELDDYVIDPPRKNGHIRNLPKRDEMERLIRRGISLCDRVVVSTQPLADALSSMHQDIRVVPNMLAPHMWTGLQSQRRTTKKPRVGWGGGTSHAGDLAVTLATWRSLPMSCVSWPTRWIGYSSACAPKNCGRICTSSMVSSTSRITR